MSYYYTGKRWKKRRWRKCNYSLDNSIDSVVKTLESFSKNTLKRNKIKSKNYYYYWYDSLGRRRKTDLNGAMDAYADGTKISTNDPTLKDIDYEFDNDPYQNALGMSREQFNYEMNRKYLEKFPTHEAKMQHLGLTDSHYINPKYIKEAKNESAKVIRESKQEMEFWEF